MQVAEFKDFLQSNLEAKGATVSRYTVEPGLEDLQVSAGGYETRLRIVRTSPPGGETASDSEAARTSDQAIEVVVRSH